MILLDYSHMNMCEKISTVISTNILKVWDVNSPALSRWILLTAYLEIVLVIQLFEQAILQSSGCGVDNKHTCDHLVDA